MSEEPHTSWELAPRLPNVSSQPSSGTCLRSLRSAELELNASSGPEVSVLSKHDVPTCLPRSISLLDGNFS